MPEAESAIIFIAWGEKHIEAVNRCIRHSYLQQYPIYMITDAVTRIATQSDFTVIRADFQSKGHGRKSELVSFLPSGFKSYLFLDTDVQVIGDIKLGFDKALMHGIAMAPAPHYSLDYFWDFQDILSKEGIKPAGQVLYNSGVIFFAPTKAVINVFELWNQLVQRYEGVYVYDQPFLTLAMEKLNFNPYSLSINYNYRGMGDPISGVVRIWHSPYPLPKNINKFDQVWPRRVVLRGRMKTLPHPNQPNLITKFKRRLRSRLARLLSILGLREESA